MSEVLTPEELIPLPIEEQISQELVKANVTEAIIADLRERLLPLKISGTDDKETYLIVQAGRKECKALRVAAKKICTNGREQAVAISKAWIAKEKDVTGRISVVEDYLEKQEVEYETGIAKEKEARKRKQEEQLIIRQQTLAAMGVLYSDGNFTLGEVSYELSLVKESEEDVWQEAILPKFKEEYEKVQAEQIEKDRLKAEGEAEFKRQQEELAQKQKDLAEKEAALKREADRQALEAKEKKEAQLKSRRDQLVALGFTYNGIDGFRFFDYMILHDDVENFCVAAWDGLLDDSKKYVSEIEKQKSEEARKEQEKIDIQNKRYAELLPFKEYGEPIEMNNLWIHAESGFQEILSEKRGAFEKAEEDRKKQIEEAAAKKERERIEEEQRQAEVKRVNELGQFRMKMLKNYNGGDDSTVEGLGKMDDTAWEIIRAGWQDAYEATVKKEQEEKKAEELAQASDKVKWASIIANLQELEIHDFRSGPYRKRAAILREKLEEIKAL
jgi:hypothetical protein